MNLLRERTTAGNGTRRNDRSKANPCVAVDLYTDATAEWSAWGVLQSLSGGGRPFGDAQQANARDALARGVTQAELAAYIAANTVPRIAAAGILNADEIARALDKGHHDPAPAMCRPIRIAD